MWHSYLYICCFFSLNTFWNLRIEDWHWVGKPRWFFQSEKRAEFFTQTPPEHGKAGSCTSSHAKALRDPLTTIVPSLGLNNALCQGGGAIGGGVPLDSHDMMFRALARLLSLLLFRALKRNKSTKHRKYQPSQSVTGSNAENVPLIDFSLNMSLLEPFSDQFLKRCFLPPVTPQPAAFPPIE